jgi:hypothetical protein
MYQLNFNPLKSLTFWGTVCAAAGWVLGDPKNPHVWAEGIGAVLTAIGGRNAVAGVARGDGVRQP